MQLHPDLRPLTRNPGESEAQHIHQTINRVFYTPAEWAIIQRDAPSTGIPQATRNGFELAAWRMPNGSRFVVLYDASEATWEAYCKHESMQSTVTRR